MGFFFSFLAIINELIWRTQTEEIWVNFKVWGILPFTFIFTIFQIPLIQRHKKKCRLNLNLVINNKFSKNKKFFCKKELQIILNFMQKSFYWGLERL